MHMIYWQDLRYAARLLRRSPLFTLLTIIVLGGGLGLSIFTFSFLYTAMLKPLPLGEGDRIVRISQMVAGSTGAFDAADAALMRPAIQSLSELGTFSARDIIVGDEGHRRVIDATIAEWNIFEITRTPPALGRGFRQDDQVAGAAPVIVISHWTWEVIFGGDSTILGKVVDIGGVPTQVIGVMPRGFGFPVASDAWLPLPAEVLTTQQHGIHFVSLFGRLADEHTAASAETELTLLLERVLSAWPRPADSASAPVARIIVRSFPEAQIGDEGTLMFTILNVIAALILLLACINVMNLLLARANERARETALRLALGASRARLVMQSMWETVFICIAGGVLATSIAAWGLGAIDRWTHAKLQGNLAFWWNWSVDRATLLSAGVFVTLAIAVLGGVVAARVTETRFTAFLRDGGVRAGNKREGRTARALVITQVATVSVLMFFGVLAGVVSYRVVHVDLGYDTTDLLTASVYLPERYRGAPEGMTFYSRLVDGLRESPAINGVLVRENVAAIGDVRGEFDVDAVESAAANVRPRAYVLASLGALGTIGVNVLQGRAFDARDGAQAEQTVIVSHALAQRLWPGQSPLGRRVRLTGTDSAAAWRVVVGVVDNVLYGNPISRDRSADALYIPLLQSSAADPNVAFRHRGDEAAAQSAFQRTVALIDPLMVPPTITTFDEMLSKTSLIAASTAKLFGSCFLFALMLAVSGTYGLMSRWIGQRTREIGVRRALGASDATVTRLLLAQGGRQLGMGVVIAVPVMVAVGLGFWRFVPVGLTVSAVAGVLVCATIIAVVLLASYFPTRRVLRVALRDALWRE